MRALLLLSLLAALRVSATAEEEGKEEEENSCRKLVEMALGKNSPEFLIQAEDDSNTFTTSHLRVTFDWSHVALLLNTSNCVSRYLVEYGPVQVQRSKRESVSRHSQVSPPLKPDVTKYAATLPDDCLVYSVHLMAVVRGEMVRSRSRLFWPAARRAHTDSFSDAVMLSWPPACAYATKHWTLEVCEDSDDDYSNCSQKVELQGDASPVHVPISGPCSLLQLKLYREQEQEEKELLWVFEDVRTLPRPHFEVLARHTELVIDIVQSGCDKATAVANWRITHCSHRQKEDNKVKSSNKVVVSEGSGTDNDDEDADVEDEDAEEEEEYYYYEGDPGSQQTCVSAQHVLEGGEGRVSITGLERCALYSIDFTPTDGRGETLQPGEQYGTIHSTLCDEEGSSKGEKSNRSGFWFEDGKKTKGTEVLQTPSEEDSLVKYILMGLGSFLAAAAAIAAILWVLHLQRRRRRRKNESSSSSPLSSAANSTVDRLAAVAPVGKDEEEEDLALLAADNKRY